MSSRRDRQAAPGSETSFGTLPSLQQGHSGMPCTPPGGSFAAFPPLSEAAGAPRGGAFGIAVASSSAHCCKT